MHHINVTLSGVSAVHSLGWATWGWERRGGKRRKGRGGCGEGREGRGEGREREKNEGAVLVATVAIKHDKLHCLATMGRSCLCVHSVLSVLVFEEQETAVETIADC